MSFYQEQPPRSEPRPGFVPFAQETSDNTSTPGPTPTDAGVLSQMWHTRPVRFPSKQGGNAKVAGVCEGLGVRYQVDPTLIRLAFVVFGFLGAGVAAYVLAWMLMPRYSVPVSPLEAIWKPGHPQDRTHGWWLLIFFLLFSGIFTSGATEFFGSASLLTYVLLAAMWWGLHKKHPLPPRGLLANGSDPAQDPTQDSTMTTPHNNFDPNPYPQPQPDLSNVDPVQGYNAPFAQQYRAETPTWDPLAPTYNTWDIQHVPAQPEKKKKRVWPWVLGGFAVAGVASMMLLFLAIDNINVGPDSGTAIGDMAITPTDGNLQGSYSSGVGELELDLTSLTPVDEERSIDISSGVGEVTVLIPEDIYVNLTCTTGIGSAECDVEGLNDNADPDAAPLNIHVSGGIGDVKVEYGS